MSRAQKFDRAITREAILAATRRWLGTPYIHQASARGAGTDCLGLVRGVYRDLFGHEPALPPPYTPDWNEAHGAAEPLLTAARAHLVPCDAAMLMPGQILIFRIVKTGPAKHCGIVCDDRKFIHAYAGRTVIESWFNRWWHERLVAAFDFPGLEESLEEGLEEERGAAADTLTDAHGASIRDI